VRREVPNIWYKTATVKRPGRMTLDGGGGRMMIVCG